jgi:hypothetical protein
MNTTAMYWINKKQSRISARHDYYMCVMKGMLKVMQQRKVWLRI